MELERSESTFRQAARVVLLDSSDRMLLARWQLGDEIWWTAPGGGLNPGESHQDAAKRELVEEVGLRDVSLGPIVWKRRHVFDWKGGTLGQEELFFVCRVGSFEVGSLDPPGPFSPEEGGHRWWSLNEIEMAVEEVFGPRRLGHFLRKLLEEGPPAEPLDVGV